MSIIVRTPTEQEVTLAQTWPVWEKEVSTFPWSYDMQETCLIISGQAEVESSDGEVVTFGAGDWVVFPAGLACTWRITQDLAKNYHFGA